jgi:hypothetical protein
MPSKYDTNRLFGLFLKVVFQQEGWKWTQFNAEPPKNTTRKWEIERKQIAVITKTCSHTPNNRRRRPYVAYVGMQPIQQRISVQESSRNAANPAFGQPRPTRSMHASAGPNSLRCPSALAVMGAEFASPSMKYHRHNSRSYLCRTLSKSAPWARISSGTKLMWVQPHSVSLQSDNLIEERHFIIHDSGCIQGGPLLSNPSI